ncbi:MAG: hypothetical protein HYU73_17705, partial [Betaproteobacteria bacterium]|nr:hypothetical protein [Betaproteobacteria bacterium]
MLVKPTRSDTALPSRAASLSAPVNFTLCRWGSNGVAVRLYLDSRDLIVLVERKLPEETARFEKKLRQGSGELIFSMHNITECCAPLIYGEGSSVMRTLNRLEQLPHVYMTETRIEALELKEATMAFLEGREYRPVGPPLVPRFDYVVSAFSDVPTK